MIYYILGFIALWVVAWIISVVKDRNKKFTIYISGKISGLTTEDYTSNFSSQELEMKYFFPEAIIINPLSIKPFLGIRRWTFFMIADIYWLLKCDAIHMAENWRDSRGARIELGVALLTGKKILNEQCL